VTPDAPNRADGEALSRSDSSRQERRVKSPSAPPNQASRFYADPLHHHEMPREEFWKEGDRIASPSEVTRRAAVFLVEDITDQGTGDGDKPVNLARLCCRRCSLEETVRRVPRYRVPRWASVLGLSSKS